MPECFRFLSASTRVGVPVLVLFCLLGSTVGSVAADDRDFLRQSGPEPYVFVLWDNSSSMGSTLDGVTPLYAFYDDPTSKHYQAKAALYEVIEEAGSAVNWGWATFDHDEVESLRKYWSYRVVTPPSWFEDIPYPTPDVPNTFGSHVRQEQCEEALEGWEPDHRNATCDSPRSLERDPLPEGNDPFQMCQAFTQPNYYPLLGEWGDTSTKQYIRHDGHTYRVTWYPLDGGQELGDYPLEIRVKVESGNGCSAWSLVGDERIVFERAWSQDVDGRALEGPSSFLDAGRLDESGFPSSAGNCAGWEPNDDQEEDGLEGACSGGPAAPELCLKYDTVSAPGDARGPAFARGDLIPLDWRNPGFATGNREEILARLAPNLRLDPHAVPDFRQSPYFEDHPGPHGLPLRAPWVGQPPIINSRWTPIGHSMQDFGQWFETWRAVAEQEDPQFDCREVSLILLTDGRETCDDALPCDMAGELLAEYGIRSYVVAFAVDEHAGAALECIAENGGTDVPYLADTKDELVDALLEVLGSIDAGVRRNFSGVTAPLARATARDAVYVPELTVVGGASVWPGNLRAFRRPLPLTEGGKPDPTVTCQDPDDTGCFLWDAGEQLLFQSPTPVEAETDLEIGPGPDERRVYYSRAPTADGSVPVVRSLLEFPTTDAGWEDLLEGFALPATDGEGALNTQAAREVIRSTLAQKTAEIPDPENPEMSSNLTYTLGEIFHSRPVLVDSPPDARYFTANLHGYRDFYRQHRFDRRVLLVGSNDGQLHAFDAGVYRVTEADAEAGRYGDGTGRELFSYMPRAVMPAVARLTTQTEPEWTVDATVTVANAFIDPLHDGTPVAAEREWRTLVVGGLRRGGRALFALDITQADRYREVERGTDGTVEVPDLSEGEWVPQCLERGVAGCGPVEYPAVVWELTDSSDDDGNGFPDLAETWSEPTVGRIQVLEHEEVVEKFVAVFGGGLDSDVPGRSGNWLYMVDVETGSILYKQEVIGSVPSPPAVVDLDGDAMIDTLYVGTTSGYLYKANVGQPAAIDSSTGRVSAEEWEPFPVFDTEGRPMFFEPSVLYVASLGKYALAFGTGNREDLFEETGETGLFCTLVDDGFAAGDDLRSPVDYPIGGGLLEEDDLLSSPQRGWCLDLEPDERVTGPALAVMGVTVFNTFRPGVGAGGGGSCARSGTSRVYLLYTRNAGPVEEERYTEVQDFVNSVYPVVSDESDGRLEGVITTGEELCADKESVRETLKALFPKEPRECRFGSFSINIQTVRSDTSHLCTVQIPVCTITHNWREIH